MRRLSAGRGRDLKMRLRSRTVTSGSGLGVVMVVVVGGASNLDAHCPAVYAHTAAPAQDFCCLAPSTAGGGKTTRSLRGEDVRLSLGFVLNFAPLKDLGERFCELQTT